MTVPYRLIVLGLAVAATVAGCDRERGASADRPVPPAAGGASAGVTPVPMAYESKTPFAEVRLTLPVAIKTQPDLHARLYAAAERDLREFTEGAQADRTEAGVDESLPPYDRTIEVRPGAETGKLFSLIRTDSEYTGGAHSNSTFGAVLWDKALKKEIAAADLFTAGANLSALDAALCAAVNAAKRERDPAAQTVALTGGDWQCPKASTLPFVLAAGTQTGKAGGLVFLIGPYIVGPFSEGVYEVVVPQSAFRALLAPAYADEFAGQPKA